MKKLFNTVAIVGVGFIGGSIGLAIKKAKLASRDIGISRRKQTLQRAKKKKAVDYATLDIKRVSEADLVVLTAPVRSIIRLAQIMKPYIKPGAVITDAGSTKKVIVSKLSGLYPSFVGSHPLAGSEKRGVSFARSDLFNNTICIVTPTKRCSEKSLSKVICFWKALGTRVVSLDPSEHDRMLSYVSHLPHLVASALIQSIPQKSLLFASSGLRDTTRIASSSPDLWNDIFLTNRKATLNALSVFVKHLHMFELALKKKQEKRLYKCLTKGNSKRQSLNI